MGAFKNPSIAALQSRSRFCEGSMNDRASAAPPVHFLGPEALAALEQPVPLPASGSSGSSVGNGNNPRASQDAGSNSGGFSQTWSRKTGSRLFGQVWEGVRDKLRLRKDDNSSSGSSKTPAAAISAAKTTTAVTTTTAEHIPIFTDPAERDGPPASRTRSKLAHPAAPAPIDIPSSASMDATTAADFKFTGFQTARPSRDEVLASYQQLMAGGFFQAHAIHSSRHGLARPPQPPPPMPGTSLPAQSTSMRPATARASSPPPQWPLASPSYTAAAAVQSPTSVSSRGTKRAAVNESDDDESMHEADDGDDAGVYDKENQAPPHPNTVHDKKRLRRSISRESLFLPKIRSSSSSRRSLSTSSHALIPPAATNKLQKRRPHANSKYQDHQQQQQYVRAASRPRHVSDGGGSARVLRGRPAAAEANRSMRVVPDEGRGIPSVPAIPAKFTYGEDRQNNGPWRGLRVR
ncbi:hypothetical protein LMH87_011595 [Akanthomyces muscarius]|uniref:Uncharacterized protein n=1 Tax=Akanthomyces muscarius TaxID=2231603 RepID=A0A9W8QA29_AKAMU|nr:hypothetical protein LMH87_011595 [Akanthomyces muscarius]KAJ4150866.1 hypothetical protein LMH87_011595 [Akanthomyces muscarius]